MSSKQCRYKAQNFIWLVQTFYERTIEGEVRLQEINDVYISEIDLFTMALGTY